ncbi:MAG: hypothetical protein RIQ99_2121 [Pseudomonadota bacterium]
MPFDLVLASPFQNRPTGKLGPVVADNAGWFAIKAHQRVEFARHAGARDAGVADQTQVLAEAIIIDSQNPELAGSAEGVGHKVHRPACSRGQRHGHRCAAATRPFAAAPTANRQPFLPVEPVELLVVHDHTLAFQHDADPAIAKAAPLASDVLHGIADGTVVRRAFAPDRFGIDTNQHAGPALGDWIISQHLEHRVPPLGWRR